MNDQLLALSNNHVVCQTVNTTAIKVDFLTGLVFVSIYATSVVYLALISIIRRNNDVD